MSDEDVRETVRKVLGPVATGRVGELLCDFINKDTRQIMASALTTRFGATIANEIVFHLVDWSAEAAFILAMHLFPERFTPEQIVDGVENFLIHAPNHVAAAAKLGGYPVEDIFEVDALDGASDKQGE